MSSVTLIDLGRILSTSGEVIIGYTALAVHHRVKKEHKIDNEVFKEMAREHILGLLGIMLLIVGLGFELLG